MQGNILSTAGDALSSVGLVLNPRLIFGWYKAGEQLLPTDITLGQGWSWYKAGIVSECTSLVGPLISVLILVLIPSTSLYTTPTLRITFENCGRKLECVNMHMI